MDVSGYTTKDLQLLQAVLDAATTAAVEKDLNVNVTMTSMARRLFDAARSGERNPEKLKEAILQPLPAVPSPASFRPAGAWSLNRGLTG